MLKWLLCAVDRKWTLGMGGREIGTGVEELR